MHSTEKCALTDTVGNIAELSVGFRNVEKAFGGTTFQDSDFAGDLEDSKSTSGGTLCVFGSHTFVPKN